MISEDAEDVLCLVADLSKASQLEASLVEAMAAGVPGVKLGRSVTTDELAASLGWPVERVKQATLELQRAGFIRSSPEQAAS